MSDKPTRPLLRYHGGKWRIASWIIQHFKPHTVYVEPYGGAASVLLRKPRSASEVYNDQDAELCNLFRICRDRGQELVNALELTPFARDEFNLSYQPSDDPLEQARRTVIRSLQGFGSNCTRPTVDGKGLVRTGFRANSTRSRSTPATDWTRYPENLEAIIQRLRGVTIENRPALQVMASHDSPTALHYLDPTYLPDTRNQGMDYRYEMTEAEHREMARFVHTLEGQVVISGYASALYEELFGDWPTVTKRALADGARERTEILWIKPDKL